QGAIRCRALLLNPPWRDEPGFGAGRAKLEVDGKDFHRILDVLQPVSTERPDRQIGIPPDDLVHGICNADAAWRRKRLDSCRQVYAVTVVTAFARNRVADRNADPVGDRVVVPGGGP